MYKILKKSFSSISISDNMIDKTTKYVQFSIESNEFANQRLINFVKNKYDLNWGTIHKAFRKKDIFIMRDQTFIRDPDEKLKINDKIYVCKFTLNIFDRVNQNEKADGQENKRDSTKIKDINKNSTKIIDEHKKIFLENKQNKEIKERNKNNNNIDNVSQKFPNKLMNMNNFLQRYFIEKENELTTENKFLLNLFKDQVIYASNLYFIIDKKYNIASQRGTYLKFSIDDCLKLFNLLNKENDLKLVHRLDRNVSGLMIVGNNIDFVRKIGEDMKESKISKSYVCLCQNIPKFFKELLKEKRLNIKRTEHFKESTKGNIFSNESCDEFSILTKSGYLYERKRIENNKNNQEENKNNQLGEFNLKKLNNFAYNKILADKISKNNESSSNVNTNENYEMQGSYRITHFIFKDKGEGRGSNFIGFDLDKIEMFDEETLEKFNEFLEKLNIKDFISNNKVGSDYVKDKKKLSLSKDDEIKGLGHMIKKQTKINLIEKSLKKQEKKEINKIDDEEFYTVVAYELITGKKHQIRKHMSKCFFTPIFNDEDYFFDVNYSYIAYKHFVLEVNKQRSLKNLNEEKFDVNEEGKEKNYKKANKNKPNEDKEFYERFNIDDFSKGIFLNSFQLKMDKSNEGLPVEKVEFYDKNNLLMVKNSNEILFQKRNLSENFGMLLYSLGLDHVYEYFSKFNKQNLI